MDPPNSDSDDAMNRKPPAWSLPLRKEIKSDSVATQETVLLLRREVRELKATLTKLRQKMELLEAVARGCPICSGWREAKLTKGCRCEDRDIQSTSVSEKSSVSSWSSNRSCLAEGYDDKPLFGWNPDPFANFNPNLMPLSTSPFCYNPDPFKAPIPVRKKQYCNRKKTRTIRKGKTSPGAAGGDNTWLLYLESMNMDESAGNTAGQSKPKRISAKKKVSKHMVGTRQQLRKKKSRKVSLESQPVSTPTIKSSPKSTSEEEF
jgi:hypothetical protein